MVSHGVLHAPTFSFSGGACGAAGAGAGACCKGGVTTGVDYKHEGVGPRMLAVWVNGIIT